MDDPNAALPSDPAVDESYTKGSRPVRPARARRHPPRPPAAPPERSAPPQPSSPPEDAPPHPRPTARYRRRTHPSLVDSCPTPGTGSSSPDASAA